MSVLDSENQAGAQNCKVQSINAFFNTFFLILFIDEDIYDGLSEESILEKIKNEIGEIPNLDEKICALFVK